MFRDLIECSITGEKRSRKDQQFLRELSTGIYSILTEKWMEYDPDSTKQLSALRFSATMVLLSLWERNPETGNYDPMLATMTNKLLKKRDKPQLPIEKDEFTQFFRTLDPTLFMEVCDHFCDQVSREQLNELYDITVNKLKAFNKNTEEALGNELASEQTSGSDTSSVQDGAKA